MKNGHFRFKQFLREGVKRRPSVQNLIGERISVHEWLPRGMGHSKEYIEEYDITADTPNIDWAGSFNARSLGVASLVGAPRTVKYDFDCSFNQLTNLIGAPKRVGSFDCSVNPLTSLEGAPEIIDGQFKCIGARFTSLHNIHKIIKVCNGDMYLSQVPISKQVLGLLLIEGVKKVFIDHKMVNILNKYLPNKHGMAMVNDCQDELINAGFEDFAEL